MQSFQRLSFFTGWAIAAALVVGLFSAFHPLADSFAHFRLHLAFLALPILMHWIVMHSWLNAIPLAIIIVVSFGSLGQLIGGPAVPGDKSAGNNPLRIISLNLHHNYADIERVADYINTVQPDVIALQEAALRPPSVTKRLQPDYPYQVICRYRRSVGVAILSRLPMTETGCVKDHRLAWASVGGKDKTVTVASLHLRWPFPSPQAAQITGLEEIWPRISTPVAILGDFNAAPWSHAVQRIEKDTGTRAIAGLRRSYVWGENVFGSLFALPIDHALVSPTLKVSAVGLGPRVSSDHLPLILDLETGAL